MSNRQRFADMTISRLKQFAQISHVFISFF
jgi:hypothetical protein